MPSMPGLKTSNSLEHSPLHRYPSVSGMWFPAFWQLMIWRITVYGRFPIYFTALLLTTLFNIGCALAPSISSLIALRFLAGLVSAAPLSNAGGTLSDLGSPITRTITLPIYAVMGFIGTVIGPLTGGFIVNSSLGWRWAYWITALMTAAIWMITTAFMPETNGLAILRYKAIRLRKLTGYDRTVIRAELEERTLRQATLTAIERPPIMLIREPIIQLFCLYLASE